MKNCLVIIIALFMCFGCTRQAAKAPQTRIIRLDSMLMADPAATAMHYPQAVSNLLSMSGFGDTLAPEALMEYVATPAFARFAPDVAERLGRLDSVELVLDDVLATLRPAVKDTMSLTLYGIVSPYRQSIVRTPVGTFVALNHYLGAEYPGYASLPQWQRDTKTLARLPYDLAEATLKIEYPYQPGDNATVLARMLYEGAVMYNLLQAVPNSTIATALSWNADQADWAQQNEKQAWQALAQRRMLFDTSDAAAERLVAPGPATTALHPEAPGQFGRYLGYKIVDAYMRANDNIHPLNLLSPAFYADPQSLQKAKYNP